MVVLAASIGGAVISSDVDESLPCTVQGVISQVSGGGSEGAAGGDCSGDGATDDSGSLAVGDQQSGGLSFAARSGDVDDGCTEEDAFTAGSGCGGDAGEPLTNAADVALVGLGDGPGASAVAATSDGSCPQDSYYAQALQRCVTVSGATGNTDGSSLYTEPAADDGRCPQDMVAVGGVAGQCAGLRPPAQGPFDADGCPDGTSLASLSLAGSACVGGLSTPTQVEDGLSCPSGTELATVDGARTCVTSAYQPGTGQFAVAQCLAPLVPQGLTTCIQPSGP